MSRVNVYRKLPPLKSALGHFIKFPVGKSRQQVMKDELRALAKKLKSPHPQPFYSMREVAKFFASPLSSVSIVYQALEKEGMLSRLRSSCTMLTGEDVLPRDKVRGVVGISIWVHSMILLDYTRILSMELEERLRHSSYVADIIFHRNWAEETEHDFVVRLLQHRLDAVILHSPHANSKQNIVSLRERGVRVLVIQRNESWRSSSAITYLLDIQTALQQMAERWYKIGIRKVWMWRPLEQAFYKSENDTFNDACKQAGLETEAITSDPNQILQKIQRQGNVATAVAFLDSTTGEHICNCEPFVIEQISRIARLAFCVGSIRLPYLRSRKVKIDVIDFSPSEIASRIARDITQLSLLPDGVRHTFAAQYREQIPL